MIAPLGCYSFAFSSVSIHSLCMGSVDLGRPWYQDDKKQKQNLHLKYESLIKALKCDYKSIQVKKGTSISENNFYRCLN